MKLTAKRAKKPDSFVVNDIDLDMLTTSTLKGMARFKMMRIVNKAVQPKQGYRRIDQ
jgi:hypothetical protein